MLHNRTLFLLVMLLIFPVSAKADQERNSAVVELRKGMSEQVIEEHVQSLRLDDLSAELSEIFSEPEKFNFSPFKSSDIPNGKSSHLLFLKVRNSSPEPFEVSLGCSQFDRLEFYIPKLSGSQEPYQVSGISISNSEKPYIFAAFSYSHFTIAPEQTVEVFIKADYKDRPVFFSEYFPKQWSVADFEVLKANKKNRNNTFRIFLGAFVIMFVYNFLLFFITKEKGYLLYSFLTIAILGFNWVFSGAAIEVFPTAEYLENSGELAGAFALGMYILFFLSLLPVKEKFPKHFKALRFALVYVAFMQIPNFMGISKYLAIPTAIVFLGTYVLSLHATYIMVFKRNYLPAKYFFWGNLIYFSTVFLAILQTASSAVGFSIGLGFEPYVYTAAGSVIELTLFSLSLGSRLKVMENEVAKERLEQERIKREAENKRNALIQEQNEMLEKRVEERTSELQERNEEVNLQNEELATQANLLEVRRRRIEKINRNLMSSILYAQRIQEAILPNDLRLKDAFRDGIFVFYRPRDIVSGDFYWYGEPEGLQIIAAVDCTGHGVPGAFMSLIGNDLLDSIIYGLKVTEPGLILEKLNKFVRRSLKQESTNNRDGMDIAICVIDKKARKLHFAGAKNPLYFFNEEGELQIIKGENKFIGGARKNTEDHFETHTVELKDSPMSFYMFSDGYKDQFGGQDNRKFMSKRFRQLLTDFQDKPMNEQLGDLENAFYEWKGRAKQTDDILVLGFKV